MIFYVGGHRSRRSLCNAKALSRIGTPGGGIRNIFFKINFHKFFNINIIRDIYRQTGNPRKFLRSAETALSVPGYPGLPRASSGLVGS